MKYILWGQQQSFSTLWLYMFANYKWILWEELDIVQQLACSFNVTMAVTLTVTGERSGRCWCWQPLCPLPTVPHRTHEEWLHAYRKCGPQHLHAQLCVTSACPCLHKVQEKQQALLALCIHPEESLMNHLKKIFLFFCLCFIAGGWKYNWKGMLLFFITSHMLIVFEKKNRYMIWIIFRIFIIDLLLLQKGETVKKMREEVGFSL